MTPKCPVPSPFAVGCLLTALALLTTLGVAVAGNNPDVTFVLHAQSWTAGGCGATGQPDCVTDQPTVNVPPGTQQRIFVYIHNVAEVAGAQTAFKWDPSWDLVGSSWNCQGNQLTIASPDPATNGGATDGSLSTVFDCTTDSTMVLLGYMDFDVGTTGCLEQVQSSYAFGNHVIDCNEGVDAFDADDPIEALRFGRICVDVGGRPACLTPLPNPDPPFLAFSPDPLNFGTVAIGDCAYLEAEISNEAVGITPDLIVSTIEELTGFGFNIEDMPPLPLAIPNGASATIGVSYCPFVEGPAAGEITISSNALNSPYVVPLIGVGTSSIASPISASWEFPLSSLTLNADGPYHLAAVEGAESVP